MLIFFISGLHISNMGHSPSVKVPKDFSKTCTQRSIMWNTESDNGGKLALVRLTTVSYPHWVNSFVWLSLGVSDCSVSYFSFLDCLDLLRRINKHKRSSHKDEKLTAKGMQVNTSFSDTTSSIKLLFSPRYSSVALSVTDSFRWVSWTQTFSWESVCIRKGTSTMYCLETWENDRLEEHEQVTGAVYKEQTNQSDDYSFCCTGRRVHFLGM